MTKTTLTTRNESYGFYGTIASITDAEVAWGLAMDAIVEITDAPETAVRDFLDSRPGRHFADEVSNQASRGPDLEAAINAALDRWMQWQISRRTSRETGIPAGLPYLMGWVLDAEVNQDAYS